MSDQQIVELIIGLLLATVLLAVLARRIRIPYPILFVLGGLILSAAPGLPRVTLPPDLLLLVFIPPLAYSAAVFVSHRFANATKWPNLG